ncbi:MAG: hypothetical protein ACFFE4_18425 [Candidatus Thorarchaeota archaeon]
MNERILTKLEELIEKLHSINKELILNDLSKQIYREFRYSMFKNEYRTKHRIQRLFERYPKIEELLNFHQKDMLKLEKNMDAVFKNLRKIKNQVKSIKIVIIDGACILNKLFEEYTTKEEYLSISTRKLTSLIIRLAIRDNECNTKLITLSKDEFLKILSVNSLKNLLTGQYEILSEYGISKNIIDDLFTEERGSQFINELVNSGFLNKSALQEIERGESTISINSKLDNKKLPFIGNPDNAFSLNSKTILFCEGFGRDKSRKASSLGGYLKAYRPITNITIFNQGGYDFLRIIS